MEARQQQEKTIRPRRWQKAGSILVVMLLWVFLFSACTDRPDDETDLGDTALTSITITPANPTLADPTTQQMTATGRYSNGTTADITDSVNWVSEYPSVATIGDESGNTSNPKGQLETVITGSTTITARSGTITGTTTVTVTSAQLQTIEVTPSYSTFATVCTPWVQMKATGIYGDGTIIDLTDFAVWSSNNTGVATVSNVSGSKGKATVVAAGTATITAEFSSISGSTGLTLDGIAALDLTAPVGPRVTPFDPMLANDSSQQFRATVILNNGTSQDVTQYVTWSSSAVAEATVSNADDSKGLVKVDPATGFPSMTADLGGNTGSVSTLDSDDTYFLYGLKINPEYPAIAQGIPYQLTAIGIFKDSGNDYYFTQDLTDQVTWSCSDTSLATISNATGSNGLLTLTDVPGAADRTATISATSPLLSTLTGSTTLTVKSNSLKLTSITIDPSDPTNHIYSTQTFKAYGTFSDGTNSFIQDISNAVVWSSSDTSVAVISNEASSAGKAVNRTDGTTTITATRDSISGTSELTVKPATFTVTTLEVTPDAPTNHVRVRTKHQMTATATFSDGGTSFTQDVTESVMWESDSDGDAGVSNVEGERGLVGGRAASAGVVITADWQGTDTDTETIVVDAIDSLDSVSITAASSAGVDGTVQLTATGAAAGSDLQDITESGIWSSSRPEVASVLNIPGKKGRVISNGSGTATITFRLTNEVPAMDISTTYDFTVDQ